VSRAAGEQLRSGAFVVEGSGTYRVSRRGAVQLGDGKWGALQLSDTTLVLGAARFAVPAGMIVGVAVVASYLFTLHNLSYTEDGHHHPFGTARS